LETWLEKIGWNSGWKHLFFLKVIGFKEFFGKELGCSGRLNFTFGKTG